MVALRLALLCTVLGWLAAARAEVEVLVDRNPVPVDESFRLTFQMNGSAEPDFSPLQRDFEILGQSRSSNLSFANGRIVRTTVWVLQMMPRRQGRIRIAPIAFGRERSRALEITIERAGGKAGPGAMPGGDLIVEAGVEPADPYVQAQAVLTARIWYAVDLHGAAISEPEIGGVDVLVRRIGTDRNYQAQRDGRSYFVLQRRYALFAQTSGTYTIAPLTVAGQVIGGTGSIFDPFGQRITTRRARSEPITVQVRPIPATARRPWLPARSVELREVWSDDSGRWRVGEPVKRTLALTVAGQIQTQLPDLQGPLPDGLKAYPEQPTLSGGTNGTGLVGLRQEQIALVPSRPGSYVLPAIEVPWWNVLAERMEIARLPEHRITVLPAPAAAAPTAPPAPVPGRNDDAPAAAPAPGNFANAPIWMATTVIASAAWLATAGAWWWSARRRRARATRPRAPRAVDTTALRRLAASGAPDRIRDALLQWAERRWPGTPPRTLAGIAQRCPAAAAGLQALDAALYSPSAQWDRDRVVAAIAALETPATEPIDTPHALAPLMPRAR
ncbi:MAG: BatD family protein [Gammaproteobacteria bacterium]